MIAYIRGKLVEKNPAYVVLECNDIAYHINVSVTTYSKIQDLEVCRLYTHYFIKDESLPVLFGFAERLEKDLFLQFLSVNGVGPNTARMILSSYSPTEIREAVIAGNIALLKSIKGIGPKSAKRIILELQDKFAKQVPEGTYSADAHNTPIDEALSALASLSISRPAAKKAIDRAVKENPGLKTVEELIKAALKVI